MDVQIREVWAYNLENEFVIIRSIIDKFPFISMDTEFPGVVFKTPDTRQSRPPAEVYSMLKKNVDALKIIQLGLTLTDVEGNLPSLGSKKHTFIWQINFKDFDLARDPHSPRSIEMLQGVGIEFERNVRSGVDSCRFSELMMSSGLVCNDEVAWVTFHGGYDFGYLVKLLTQRPLPNGLREFIHLVAVFFGEKVYDVKYIVNFCNGLHGGLDRVAQLLGVERSVGRSHQSGSDSLLTSLVFLKIRDVYFSNVGGGVGIDKFAGFLFGLEVS